MPNSEPRPLAGHCTSTDAQDLLTFPRGFHNRRWALSWVSGSSSLISLFGWHILATISLYFGLLPFLSSPVSEFSQVTYLIDSVFLHWFAREEMVAAILYYISTSTIKCLHIGERHAHFHQLIGWVIRISLTKGLSGKHFLFCHFSDISFHLHEAFLLGQSFAFLSLGVCYLSKSIAVVMCICFNLFIFVVYFCYTMTLGLLRIIPKVTANVFDLIVHPSHKFITYCACGFARIC